MNLSTELTYILSGTPLSVSCYSGRFMFGKECLAISGDEDDGSAPDGHRPCSSPWRASQRRSWEGRSLVLARSAWDETVDIDEGKGLVMAKAQASRDPG